MESLKRTIGRLLTEILSQHELPYIVEHISAPERDRVWRILFLDSTIAGEPRFFELAVELGAHMAVDRIKATLARPLLERQATHQKFRRTGNSTR